MLLRLLFTTLFLFLSSGLLAFDEAKVAVSLGLELVSEGHPFNFFGVNSVYVNDDMSRQMLVVSNVEGELKEKRIFHHKGFLIVEIPKTSTSYTSIAFVGIKEDEVNEKIKTTSVWKKIWNELKPVRRVYAEEDCGLTSTTPLTGISQIASHYGTNVIKSSLRCINQINQGFNDGTVGRLKDFNDGLIELFKDPKAFWEKKVQALKNVGEFITHFDVKMKELSVALTKLSPDVIAGLICSFIGGMGADALITLMAGGLGIGKLLFRIEEFVSKLISMPREFFERLTRGKVSDSELESLKTLAHYDFPDFVEGAMSCSL
jgi:hypothetical protein